MGQKTAFNLEDWDFPEEKSMSSEVTPEPSAQANEPSAQANEPSMEIESSSIEVKADDIESLADTESLIEVHGNKLHINDLDNNQKELTQEEEAFKRQIEDLFELLEMEKIADKSKGVRVYQTDPSPSRPWRFH